MSLSFLLYSLAALYAVSVMIISITHASARKAIFRPNKHLSHFGSFLVRGMEAAYLLAQPLAIIKQSLCRPSILQR